MDGIGDTERPFQDGEPPPFGQATAAAVHAELHHLVHRERKGERIALDQHGPLVGERQRVRLARILAQLEAGRTVHDRQLLILDEPLAGLDLKHQVAAMAAARAFADEGHAVLAVVHDLWAAAHYSDCVLALQNGRAAEFGPPETVLAPERVRALFDLPPGTAVEAYLTAARDAVGRRPSQAARQGNAAD